MTKLCILVIASDSYGIYLGCQQAWRERMSNYKPPEGTLLDYYFLKCNPELSDDYIIEENTNTIWIKYIESIIPGVYYKTIKAFELIADKYDYILRTNVTSFFLFDRLFTFLNKCQKTNIYAGMAHGGGTFVSGAGYIISNDVLNGILKNKDAVDWKNINDDPCVGYICLNILKLSILPFKQFECFYIMEEKQVFDRIDNDKDMFHIRVRTEDYGVPGLRHLTVLGYHSLLNVKYYPSRLQIGRL